jgi:hypothetical protein
MSVGHPDRNRVIQAATPFERARADLSETAADPKPAAMPRLAAGKHDKPAIRELVENIPHDLEIEQVWIAEGFIDVAGLQR